MKNTRFVLVPTQEKLFCAFLTLGFPDISTTEYFIEEFEKKGVDIIELGFPFSDPMADGPTIQYSSEKAIEQGVKIQDAFGVVSRLRKKGVKVPIVFFTYLNPIFHYGLKRFAKDAKKAGFDAVLVPDLPPDEEKEFSRDCQKLGIAQIFLVAPTSNDERQKLISQRSNGFIYYVSLRGVTGARKALPEDIRGPIAKLKKKTKKPVLIGFGVSTPEQARALSAISDGVIVGSAIVDAIKKSKGNRQNVVSFVEEMVRATKKA